MQPTDVRVVITTVPGEADAESLVRALLAQRVIACGTIVPGARSLYRWEGSVVDTAEVMVVLKTAADRLDALEAACAALHPYDVPELLALDVAAGSAPYLAWVVAESDTRSLPP